MTDIKASVVILDYLKAPRVCQNVRSLLRQLTNFAFEVIVVDNSVNTENARQLMALEKHSNVRVIINDSNSGYTRGNNQGVEYSHGEYILIVNPDILWGGEANLQAMVDHMEANPEIGVLGPKQINDGTGAVAMTVRAFPRFVLQLARRTSLRHLPILRRLVAHDEMRHLDYNKTQVVDTLQSSFWIIRRALWERLGGLDTSYRIFMSDYDFCWRSWAAGYQVVLFVDAVVHADGVRASAGGVGAFFRSWILRQHVKDSLRYEVRHLFRANPRRAHWQQG